MALRIVLVAIVLVLAALVSVGAMAVGAISKGSLPGSAPPVTTATQTQPAAQPSGTNLPVTTITPAATDYTAPPPVPTTSASAPPVISFTFTPPPPSSSAPGTTVAGVRFDLVITSVAMSGLDITIGARLTNSGSADAHNVQARVEVFSGGQRVKIGGQDYLQDTVGTLAAGKFVERQEHVTLSATEALNLLTGSGKFTVKLTVSSDELTQQTSSDYSL